jgi:hypothetical protein
MAATANNALDEEWLTGRGEFDADAAQTFAQELLARADPDPNVTLEADVRTRHDQCVLAFTHAVRKIDARKIRVVLQ